MPLDKELRRLRNKKYNDSPKGHTQKRKANAKCTESGLHSVYHIKSRYGINETEWLQKIQEQDNRCAICMRTFSNEYRDKLNPVMDHNHACCPNVKTCGGCLRGVLCKNCNISLGLLGESISTLHGMLRYLEKYNEKSI